LKLHYRLAEIFILFLSWAFRLRKRATTWNSLSKFCYCCRANQLIKLACISFFLLWVISTEII